MRKGFKQIPVILVFVLSLFALPKVIRNRQIFITQAASCGELSVLLSTDGKNPSQSITLPSGIPTKYYIHVKSNNLPCETTFDVKAQKCVGTNCGGWGTRSPWGPYKTDSRGIARLDLDGPWPENITMNMQVKPEGQNIPWSNTVSVTFKNIAPFPQIPVSDYYVFKPGYTWLYETKNNLTNEKGINRIQIEDETSFCGIRFFPWRFTKNSASAYWGPGTNRNLRWFVVNPNFYFNEVPSYNNYFWAFGHRAYSTSNPANGVNGARDINFVDVSHQGVYKNLNTLNPPIPSYNLSPKYIPSDMVYIAKRNDAMGVNNWPPSTSCSLTYNYSRDGYQANSSWKLRIEKDYLPGYGEVMRTDQYEGESSLENGMLLRESWYFAKNIGPVKILTKTFNHYAGNTYDKHCKDDSDCWADTIEKPFIEVDLLPNQYFQNQTLTVQLSTDGVNYSNSITTTQNNGYYLKVTPPYTGYLEAYAGPTNPPFRWLWVENGVVRIPNPYAPGVYNSKFRIWIPNETVAGETRLRTTQIPWSNVTTTTITGDLPQGVNCKNSTWYTSYNFSGLNWCPVDNRLCATDWINLPQVSVSCGSGRLMNVGNYCSRSDGTRSFTGSSSCVQ